VYGAVFAAITLLQSGLLFLLMQAKRDNSLIDIAYGPMFFVSAVLTMVLLKHYTLPALLIAGGIGIWSLRLSYRIGKKNWGKPEDIRYAAWREAWMKQGTLYFIFRSFLQINILQALLIVLIASPFIISLTITTPLWPLLIVGSLVTMLGLSLETIADRQIDQFINAKQAGTTQEIFYRNGLFRFSRRPNYFGETLVWWGFALITVGSPFAPLAFIGPLTITYIVTKITGPMIEKIFIEKYGDPYKTYMSQTSYFIPLPPKQ
jgi:steroid 5-alpha reductase family enzyme